MDASVCSEFGALGGLGAKPALLCSIGSLLQAPPWPPYISRSPLTWLCGFLHSWNNYAAAVSWSTPPSNHKQHTRVRSRSSAAYARRAASACTTMVFSGRRTFQTWFANASARSGNAALLRSNSTLNTYQSAGLGVRLWRPPGLCAPSAHERITGHRCRDSPNPSRRRPQAYLNTDALSGPPCYRECEN